jgi:aspartate carbamoyltransferase regulatory subunit
MTKTFSFLFLAGLLLLTSCIDSECIEETKAYMKVSFYSYETKKIALPDSVTLYGAGNADTLYDNKNKKIIPLAIFPLKNSDNETEFIIKINGTADTIRFLHSNTLHFISKECGYSMYHTMDTVYFTNNEIDSISFTNKEITVRKIENVAIFY